MTSFARWMDANLPAGDTSPEPLRAVLGLSGLERPVGRHQRLDRWMRDNSVDVCILAGAEYATQMCGYARYYGGPSAVVVDSDGRRTLAVAAGEAAVAEQFSTADVVAGYGPLGFGLEPNLVQPLVARLGGLPTVRDADRIAVADALGGVREGLTLEERTRQIDATGALEAIRMVPDEDELVALLHAYQLSWRGQAAVAELARSGISEIELFTAAHAAGQLWHGAPVQFMTDMASGKMTWEVGAPTHVAGRRALEAGDPVIADILIGANGYWGDTAETHIVGENPEISDTRAKLLELLRLSGKELKPGETGSAIYKRMEHRIREAFPAGTLRHHGGHGVGLSAFENPHMVPGDDTPLVSGMLISLEPGVYVPGRHGVRVENSFLVTPDGGVELRDAFGLR